MTPDSLIDAFSLLDRWRTMLAQMMGEPAPLLPPLPSHLHRLCDEEADPAGLRAADLSSDQATKYQHCPGFEGQRA